MCSWISYYFRNVVVLIIFGLILRSTTKNVTENRNKTIFSNIFINTYFCRTQKLFLSCSRIGFTRPSYLNDDRTTKHLYIQFIRYRVAGVSFINIYLFPFELIIIKVWEKTIWINVQSESHVKKKIVLHVINRIYTL